MNNLQSPELSDVEYDFLMDKSKSYKIYISLNSTDRRAVDFKKHIGIAKYLYANWDSVLQQYADNKAKYESELLKKDERYRRIALAIFPVRSKDIPVRELTPEEWDLLQVGLKFRKRKGLVNKEWKWLISKEVDLYIHGVNSRFLTLKLKQD